MKVLYIFLDSTKSPGVIKKVKSKIKLLNGNGIETEGVFINVNINERSYNKEEGISYVPFTAPQTPFVFNRRYIRNFKKKFEYNNWYKHLYKTLDEEVSAKNFDLLLFRYPLANKFLYQFVKKYAGRVVFEHNSKELIELRLNSAETKTLLYSQEKKYGGRVLKLAKALTGVGNEVTIYEVQRSGLPNKPTAVISNSIEVAALKPRSKPQLNKKDYYFLFLTGSPSPWVGIDIVLRSLAEFKSDTKKIKLYIVGPKSDSLKLLSDELGLNETVVFTGEKTGAELDAYFDKCHVGFGTMAMQRVGLQEHSSLKILEYAARGMPFIIGYNDTNFTNKNDFKPFVLKLPYNNSTFDFNKVISFTDSVFEIKEHSEILRSLAFKYLDTSLKMTQLREFLLSLKNSK